MYRTAGLSHLPFLRRRDWLWFHVAADGAPLGRLWQEEQAGVLHISGATGDLDLQQRAVSLYVHLSYTVTTEIITQINNRYPAVTSHLSPSFQRRRISARAKFGGL